MPAGFWRVRAEGGARRKADAAEITRALGVLCDPAFPVQVQALQSSLHWKHFPPGRHREVAAAAASLGREEDIGVYLTLNPFAAGWDRCVNNEAITGRRWLMVDCDSVKPPHSNATDAEKDCARELALKVMDHLTEQGWPQPVGIDSGNGWHLLYRVDLPNDAPSKALCKDVLKALAKRFTLPGAVVDIETYQAKQQTKLPGTEVRKGPYTPERPCRMARLAWVPDVVQVVSAGHLQPLAAEVRKDAPKPPKVNPWRLRVPGRGDRAYAEAALKYECIRLQTCPVGRRNVEFNSSVFTVATLIQPGLLQKWEVEAAFELTASQIGLLTAGEAAKTRDTLARAIKEGMANPRTLPANGRPSVNGAHQPPPAGQAEPEAEAEPLWTVTLNGEILAEQSPDDLMADALKAAVRPGPRLFEILTMRALMEQEFPPPAWCIPGLLAEGLNALIGSPKMGKSMLALNLALTVAAGGKALGNIQTVPGDVLYLSLEDKLRRVQARARKMVAAIGHGSEDRLSVVTAWPRMDQGGLVLLGEWVKRVERPTLIVVDVLGRFRPASRERGNQYEQDYAHMSAIKEFADGHGLTALVTHHTRKSRGKEDKEGDVFEGISGTQGVAGPCDGLIMLHRVRNSNDAEISLTGRDDAEQKLALRFAPETLTWTSLGSAEEHLTGRLQVQVLDYLRHCTGKPVFPRDVADHLGHDGTGRVRVLLHRMFDKGIVQKMGNAWVYPGPGERAEEESF